MKLRNGLLLALSLSAQAYAADVEVCNLNTQYGFELDAAEVRIANEQGQLLVVSRSGLQFDGRQLKADRNDDNAAFESALRKAVPAAIAVSRMSYEMTLSGLSRDFYSRHREARWIPYVRAYQASMLERYDARVKSAPLAAIGRGGLAAAHADLTKVSREGLSSQVLEALRPLTVEGVTVEQEVERLDALSRGNPMRNLSNSLCRQVRELGQAQAKVFAGTGLGEKFDIAVNRQL